MRAAALAERLKTRVAASTWSNVGGPGEVYFDPPSQCLIVLQSQPAQAAVERLLAAGPQQKGEGEGRANRERLACCLSVHRQDGGGRIGTAIQRNDGLDNFEGCQ